jgi:hypothetical protein
MAFIDEKGRIFGKINVVDFMLVALIAFVAPAVYLTYRVFTQRAQEKVDQFIELEINCNFTGLNPEAAEAVKVGDRELDANGNVIGEVIWRGETTTTFYRFEFGTKEMLVVEDKTSRQVPVRLKIKANVVTDELFYINYKVAVGSFLDFTTSKYAARAWIVESPPERRRIGNLELNVILKNITPANIPLISEGDKELDDSGRVIARISKLGKIENNIYDILLGPGNIIKGEDTEKKQIYVKMIMSCEIDKTGQLFFKEQKIPQNVSFPFITDKYKVDAALASVLLNEKWLEVKMGFIGVIPEVSNLIREGDIESEPTGRIVGRLKKITSIKASESLVLMRTYKMVTVSHPFLKDIEAELNILCVEKEGVLYFKNFPIKIGNTLNFTTDNYNISGTIVGME